MKLDSSLKVYFILILILSVFSAINVFLPQGNLIPASPLPASKPVMAVAVFFIMIILYGGIGLLGFFLSRKLGFADIIDKRVSNKQRFFIPLLWGAAIGIFIILADILFSRFNVIGKLPHPPFPTSIFASATAGIGEELMFRLFFISFWTWLFSYVLLRKKFQNAIFWIFAVVSALAFSLGHLPSIMLLYNWKAIAQVPSMLIAELILLNGAISIAAAYYFRKYGFLAAVGIHFWTDVVWHVIYGSF